jgi:hypothetical protein
MLRRLLQQQEEPHRGALKQKTSAEVGSCLQQMAAFKKSIVGLPALPAFRCDDEVEDEVGGSAWNSRRDTRKSTRGNRKYPEISREKQKERKKEYVAQTKTRQKMHQSNPPGKKKQPPFGRRCWFQRNEFSYDTLFSRRTDSSIIARRRHIGSLPAAEFVEPVGRETTPVRRRLPHC